MNNKMVTTIKKLILFLSLPILTSCANVLAVSTLISPNKVDKESLKNLPEVITPRYHLRVSLIPPLSKKTTKIVTIVDNKFSEFSRCMEITDDGEKVRQYLVGVVDGTFDCKYHRGKCNGEYDPNSSLIIVAYKAFNREGTLPLLKHEWAHAYGFLKPDDSNLEEVKRCTKY